MKVKIFLILSWFILGINAVNAAGSFNAPTFIGVNKTDDNDASNIQYGKPGDIYGFAYYTKNGGDAAINNVYVDFTFSHSLNEYILAQRDTNEDGVDPTDLDSSDFNPGSDNTAPVCDSLPDGKYGFILKFQFKLNTYYTEISGVMKGDNVDDSAKKTVKIYTNVNPHITDYSFSSSSIVNNGNDTVDLTVLVKDYNGYENVDGGTVTVDLTGLGLGDSEALTYDTNSGSNIAIFKKTGIQTTENTGDITFNNSGSTLSFKVTDEDGNENMPDDSNTDFDDEDKTDDLVLTIASPNNPVVEITGLSDNYIGPNESADPDSQVTFSGSQAGKYKLVINGNGTCSTGTVIYDWTDYTDTGSSVTLDLNSSDLPDEGGNTIYTCVKNSDSDVGSANIGITKDSVDPDITSVSVSPANVVSQDSSIGFKCGENGLYKVEDTTSSKVIQDWTSVTGGDSIDIAIPNGDLSKSNTDSVENIINIYCKDNAGNIGTGSGTVTAQQPTPSMSGDVTNLSDNDTGWSGIDGRDISVSWDTATGVGFSGFESYRIYILPDGTALNTTTHNYVGLVVNASSGTWIGASTLTKDSAGNDFANGTYKTYVAIMGSSGDLGEAGSATGDLVYDNITNPKLQSAKFIANNTLQLEFDLDLKTATGEHLSYSDESIITYEVGGNAFTGTSVQSVSGKEINIKIPNLGNTFSTGSNLYLGTGSIREDGGGYITATGGFLIADGIASQISNFTGTTAPTFTTSSGANFYSGSLVFSYNFSEEMKGGGDTRFEFTRESGNTDSDTHKAYLTVDGDLSSGDKNYSVDINSLNLISGTCYKVQLIGKDLAGNLSNTNYIGNICYDNIGPSIPNLVPFPNNLDENDNYSDQKRPTLTWFSLSDNENESGLKEYNIQVSTVSDFSTNFVDTNIGTESYTFSSDLTDGQYFWKVQGVDNLSNTGSYSASSDFIIDVSSATILNIRFNSETRGVDNIEYASTGRTVDVLSDVGNSSGACIRLNLDPIGGGTGILANTYTGGVATWTGIVIGDDVSEGLKNIKISAKNSECLGDLFENGKNLGIDNTQPQIGTGITFPLNGDFLSGEGTGTTKISWDTSSIEEQNFNYLKINFYDGNSWQNIGNNLPNNGQFDYDFPDLNISNAKISMEVFDKAGHLATQTGTEFILDSVIPNFSGSTVLKYPNGGEKFMGGENISISWSGSLITDDNLADNPISLFYSTDGGTNFSSIGENLSNSGNFSWTIPNLNSNTLKIKILAKDKSGNENFDLSNGNFSIDSIKPEKISSKILDLDKNGKLDTVEVNFSENILDSSVKIGDFSLDNGYSINNFDPTLNGDSENDNKIYLSITEKNGSCDISDQSGCDTDAVLTLNYDQDGESNSKVSDLVGNTLDNFSQKIADGISPIVLGREVFDSNNDGILDQVKIYFSETMDASQVSNNSFELESSLGKSLTETYDQGQDDGNSLILGFSDGVGFNTNDLVRSKISSNEFMDLAGNSAKIDSDFISSSDKAKPIFRTETQKVSGQEKIKVDFSEPVNISSTGTWNISNGITVNSTETGSNFITFDVSGISDTGITPSVEYSETGDIVDLSGNVVNTGSVIATDKILPEIISAETLDTDSNGNIDRVKLTFSENIDDSTLIPGNFSIGASSASSFETGTGNDTIGELVFSTEIKGTDLKDLIYNGTKLTDLNGNILPTISSTELTETDGAGPAITSAYYVEGSSVEDDELIINFSENVDDGSLEIGDFAVEGTGSFSNGTITTGTANDNQIKIDLNSGDERLVIGDSKIKFSGTGVADDLNSNSNSQTYGVTVNGSVIINEVNWAGSTGSTADEYIELRNMGSNSVDISNWVIDNAENGTGLTIPDSTTIAGNGYFLIANFTGSDADSVLDVAPNLVNSDLDLADSSNGDLVLKDSGGNIMDSAEGDTWPAGDSTNFYSMERKENPGDGLDLTSWYSANGRTNLDSGAEKGTPGAENIFDANPPVFDLSTKYPLENKLHLISQPEISIQYSDDLTGVDTTNSKLYLSWGDGDCDFANPKDSAIFTQNKVSIIPGAEMPGGKNKVCVKLFDNAGNESDISWDFRIEKFSFNVEEISPVNEILTPTVDEIFDGKTKVTIKTYGAGVDISAIVENLTSGDDEIRDQDMFYDSKLVKNGSLVHDYNGYLDVSNESLENFAKVDDLTTDGELKTYEIYLKYKFNVNAIQPTGNYVGNISFFPKLTY